MADYHSLFKTKKQTMIKIIFRLGLYSLFFCLVSCSQQSRSTDPIPTHKIFKIKSNILGETRVITVWTPPDYDTSEKSYPVLYMLDGGINEDFPHIANTISGLVEQGKIAPLLIVGIKNTERRRDLTGASDIKSDATIAPISDGASQFRNFINTELFSEVSKYYRVNDKRAIVGESVAGLFIVETLLLEPEMFDIYIAMDPSLWWNNSNLVRNASRQLKLMPKQPVRFWFAGSDAEDIFQYTEQLSEILDSNAPENLEWTYLPQPEEHHHTIFRATKESAFNWGLWKNKLMH